MMVSDDTHPTLDDEGTVLLEIERLITGKVLVQAMSGGGKSYAVRRILEQTYGAAQHIVFDPEGEYHTLREICDYVLVGPGGEGPATLETAAKMATRLLELGVSAIIDISELGTSRAEYIKRFLTSVMDAPRALWHPLLLAIDEAQKFCPEKGAGEAASTEAIKDYATRGRKRGYSLICATQRIAELHKTVIAECQNKLIGRTSLDVDIDRARRPLGMSARDADDVLPHLDAGCFYVSGFGAKGKARQIQIGEVATTHPRAGMGSVPVTPPRSKIKAILAKFADIPKEAEIEAKTVDELRAKIRSLEAAAVSPNTMTPPVSVKEYRALDDRANALERRVIETEKERDEARSMERVLSDVNEDLVKQIDAAIDVISQMPGVDEMKRTVDAIGQLSKLANALHDVRNASLDAFTKEVEERDRLRRVDAPVRQPTPKPEASVTKASARAAGMPAMQRAMLTVLAQRGGPSTPILKKKILIWSNYANGGATIKAFATLVQNGWATSDGAGSLSITVAGLHALGSFEPLPKGRDLRSRIASNLPAMEFKMFDSICNAWPHSRSKKEVLEATGYANGGATIKAFAYLVAREYVTPDGAGRLKAARELFE